MGAAVGDGRRPVVFIANYLTKAFFHFIFQSLETMKLLRDESDCQGPMRSQPHFTVLTRWATPAFEDERNR